MTVVLGKPTSIVVPASCRELLIHPPDFLTPSGVSIVPRLRGDDDKKETGMSEVVGGEDCKEERECRLLGKPTSIVVPALCRELLIQPTDFPTSSGVSLVPRLRGDDDKKETGMTEVVGGDDGKEEAGMTAVMGWDDRCIRHG